VKEFYDNLTLNRVENTEVIEAVAEAEAIPIEIPVAIPVARASFEISQRIDNNVRVIKINPTENDILERKLFEIGILH
jgi:hypothetical protein